MRYIASAEREGRYGHTYSIGLRRGRPGPYYLDVSGFGWDESTGGQHQYRYRILHEEDAERIQAVFNAAKAEDNIVTLSDMQDFADSLVDDERATKRLVRRPG